MPVFEYTVNGWKFVWYDHRKGCFVGTKTAKFSKIEQDKMGWTVMAKEEVNEKMIHGRQLRGYLVVQELTSN